MSIKVAGTEGYADTAQSLISQWQSIPFAEHHSTVLHLIPQRPSRILDIGAGIGSDAAGFAAMGHSVLAVEPVDELRVAANDLHPSCNVEWLDDSLPALAMVLSRRERFDVVMLTAVWMHLDKAQRFLAMPVISSLLHKGGTLIMSLRHGPIPPSRRMFNVSSEETIQLASNHDLRLVFALQTESVQQKNRHIGVNWTRLAFEKNTDVSISLEKSDASSMSAYEPPERRLWVDSSHSRLATVAEKRKRRRESRLRHNLLWPRIE